jgi:hypothetical protein
VYFTIGGNKYLNNHQGGEDNLRLATHNPIGQNNKCSLWTLHQYDEGETDITSVKTGAQSEDGVYVLDEEVIIVRNNQRYNLKGQNLK